MNRVLGKPNLGGWLAIAHCLLVFSIFFTESEFRDSRFEYMVLLLYLLLVFPFGFLFLPGLHGFQSNDEVVVLCIAIGVNSFIWGYGLAWFWRMWRTTVGAISKECRGCASATSPESITVEPILSHRWPIDGYPLAQINIRVDELGSRLGMDVKAWDVDGLGPARGFGFRLSSGRVYLLQELEHSVRYHGFCGPTLLVDAGDLAANGSEQLVDEVVKATGLSRSDITNIANAESMKFAAELVKRAAADIAGPLP